MERTEPTIICSPSALVSARQDWRLHDQPERYEVTIDYFPWNDELQCEVCGIAYDYFSRQGECHIWPGSCPDHEALIALFERIDPQVQQFVYRPADTLKIEYTFWYRKSDMQWHVEEGDWT